MLQVTDPDSGLSTLLFQAYLPILNEFHTPICRVTSPDQDHGVGIGVPIYEPGIRTFTSVQPV